jgi:hypothetical protein
MVAGQELGFVDEHAIELALLQFLGGRLEQVYGGLEAVRSCIEGDPRGDLPGARPVVERGGTQDSLQSARAVVEIGL